MDTSKEYIDMCQKATELQDMWNPAAQDTVKPDNFVCAMVVTNIESDGALGFGDFGNTYQSGCVWLPSHDQIHELFPDVFGTVGNMMGFNFLLFLVIQTQEQSEYYNSFGSIDQLFLAFIMDYKYSKAWYNKNWKEI